MDRIKVTFQDAKGNTIKTIEGNEGDDLLSLAHEHDVDLEGMSLLSPSLLVRGPRGEGEGYVDGNRKEKEQKLIFRRM